MPVLHTYRSKEGHYILAGVNGRIVTYRLSSVGARRLKDNSITDGDKFSWQVLLELIRQGDAYTNAPGAEDEDLSGWTQLGLLFDIQGNEPSSADPVPLCSCGSMTGLHIVELMEQKTATMLCQECRVIRCTEFDASIPIYMINTPSALERLLEHSGLKSDESLSAFRNLLNITLSAKWDSRIRTIRTGVQSELFQEPDIKQQSLL
jgi:hypothetical protein